MKTALFIFFLLLLLSIDSKAVAPYGLKGQEQSTIYPNVHQVPNNQVTYLGGINALVETGNKNILANPSFEHSTYSTSWTIGTGSPAVEQVVLISGKKSLFVTYSAETASVLQDSTLYQAQFADGVQGLASAWVKTIVSGIKVCPRQAGTTSSTCVDVNNDGKWALYKVPFVLGGTSNGIFIGSTSNVTGDIYVDDVFVGAADIKSDIDQSRIAGEAYIAGTASCTGWTRTSTTIGAFATDADCPGPTITYSTMGQWQTTDVDLPEFTVNNLPPGHYKATFFLPHFVGTSNNSPVLAINDGSTTCQAVRGNGHNSAQIGQTVSCVFKYTEAGNRSFELYTATASGTSDLPLSQTSPQVTLKFILEYYGSSQVYTASCGANCVDEFVAKANSSGTISGENVDFINGNCAITSTSTFTCDFVSGIFTTAPVCTPQTLTGGSGTPRTLQVESVSTTQLVYRTHGTTSLVASATAAEISCKKTGADFTATRLIQGQFKEVMTMPGLSKPKTCRYAFGGSAATLTNLVECSTGTCVEVYDSCGTGTPPAFSATGVYTGFSLGNGTFAANTTVLCECNAFDATDGQARRCYTRRETGQLGWASDANGAYATTVVNTDTAGVQNGFIILDCKGQAP